MGLIARAIEAAGIPTVTVGVLPDYLEMVGPPRAVWCKHPTGATFGEPGNAGKQQAILKDALGALETMSERGTILPLGYEWRRS